VEAPAPEPAPTAAPAGGGSKRAKASPLARRIAADRGVDLLALSGTGPRGRIVKADVLAATPVPALATPEPALAAPAAAAAPVPAAANGVGPKGAVEVQGLSRLQQTVSRRMAEAKATIPEFSLSLTVDMTAAVELRSRLKEETEQPPSFNDLIVKAAAQALREHPRVNGAYRENAFELYERVNVGIAVAADDALVVPTIFDADRKSIGQIGREARALAGKVRDGSITAPELSGATLTVSNLGMFGVEQFSAIVNPPQAAILAVGALVRRPAVVEEDRIEPRDQVTLTLVCDHRILYGADGAQFLADVRRALERPLSLAL